MLKKMNEKMMDLFARLMISGGELAVQQCCFGALCEIEIPEELIK